MASLIDEYVTEVGRGLHGPARLRADMLAEIRDALHDAAEAEDDPERAEERAIAQFGPPRLIAEGLQDALAVARGRRTARLLLVVLGAQWAVSAVVGMRGWPQWEGATPGRHYLWLAEALDVLTGVTLFGAAAALIALGTGVRRLGLRRDLVRLVAVLTATTIGLTAVAGLLLSVLSPGTTLGSALVGTVPWAVPLALVLASAWRSWQAASAVSGSPGWRPKAG